MPRQGVIELVHLNVRRAEVHHRIDAIRLQFQHLAPRFQRVRWLFQSLRRETDAGEHFADSGNCVAASRSATMAS